MQVSVRSQNVATTHSLAGRAHYADKSVTPFHSNKKVLCFFNMCEFIEGGHSLSLITNRMLDLRECKSFAYQEGNCARRMNRRPSWCRRHRPFLGLVV